MEDRRGSSLSYLAIVVGLLVVVIFGIATATKWQTNATQQKVAQAQIAQAAEEGKTERERINAETRRQAMEIRAEQDQRAANLRAELWAANGPIVALIMALVVLGIIAGMLGWWFDRLDQRKQTRALLVAQEVKRLERGPVVVDMIEVQDGSYSSVQSRR